MHYIDLIAITATSASGTHSSGLRPSSSRASLSAPNLSRTRAQPRLRLEAAMWSAVPLSYSTHLITVVKKSAEKVFNARTCCPRRLPWSGGEGWSVPALRRSRWRSGPQSYLVVTVRNIFNNLSHFGVFYARLC